MEKLEVKWRWIGRSIDREKKMGVEGGRLYVGYLLFLNVCLYFSIRVALVYGQVFLFHGSGPL